MLIYKGNNKKYIFFDPNEGAIGFNSSNGDSCLEINELFEIIRILINKYSYYEYIYKDNSLPDSCHVFINLKNATLILREVDKYYSAIENPNTSLANILINQESDMSVSIN